MTWISSFSGALFVLLAQATASASELYDAVLASNVDAVQVLLANGANVTEQGELGTPLHVAAVQGNRRIADILVAKGADIEASREGSSTRPLHQAASFGNLDVVALLIEKGAKVDVRNELGSTPLHEAVQGRHSDVVKVLLDHGADINASNTNHHAALILR